MIDELALTTQWCSGHRTTVYLADLIQPTEEVTGRPTSHKRAGHNYRVLPTHGPTVFTFFFFFNFGRQWYFFSLLCASATQFQLFDQLAKRTSHKNSFDIDLKLDLLLKSETKKPKRQTCLGSASNPQLIRNAFFLNIPESNWPFTVHISTIS